MKDTQRKLTRTCSWCNKIFLAKKKREAQEKYCSEKCRREAMSVSKKWCPSCGTEFKPNRGRQVFCSVLCCDAAKRPGYQPKTPALSTPTAVEEKPRRRWMMTFGEYCEKQAKMFQLVDREKWTRKHLWSWLIEAGPDAGFTVRTFPQFTVVDWQALKRLEKKAKSVDRVHFVLEEFFVSPDHFIEDKRQKTFPRLLTPLALDSWWYFIDGRIMGHKETTWALAREDAPVIPWVKENAPRKTRRVAVSDWENIPESKWSLSTLWFFTRDMIDPWPLETLNRYHRGVLQKMVETKGMQDTINLITGLGQNYEFFLDRFEWCGPLTPSQVLKYWDSIAKLLLHYFGDMKSPADMPDGGTPEEEEQAFKDFFGEERFL